MTPRLLAMHFAARAKAAEADHRRVAWAVWTAEALRRSNRLPRLEDVMGRQKVTRPAQTWEQQLATLKTWTSAAQAAAKR